MTEEQFKKIIDLLVEIRDLLQSGSLAPVEGSKRKIVEEVQETAWGDYLKKSNRKMIMRE